MTNHPNRKQTGRYAIVDAEGAFDSAGRGKSWVHGAYGSEVEAIRAAKRMKQVQIICANGDFCRGELVYQDAIGGTYSRVPFDRT